MAEITKEEALRLFSGYTNNSMPVMRKFIDLVFGLVPPEGGYLPIEGGTMQGNINIPQGNNLVFQSADGLTDYAFIRQNGNVTSFNVIQPDCNLQCFANNQAVFRGGEITIIGTANKLTSFFGGTIPVGIQAVPNDIFSAPSPDFSSVITAITDLQNVVNGLRSGVVALNLFVETP